MVLPQAQRTPKRMNPHVKIVSNLLPEAQQQNGLFIVMKKYSHGYQKYQCESVGINELLMLKVANRPYSDERVISAPCLLKSDVCTP